VNIVISLVVAYFLCSLAEVASALTADLGKRPQWAFRPTLGSIFLYGALWFVNQVVNTMSIARPRAKGFVAGVLGAVLQLAVITTVVWGSITLSHLITDTVILQVVIAVAMVVVLTPIAIPILTLVSTPVVALVMLPVSLLFPSEDRPRDIKWCKTCKYYRKSREYEAIPKGLWRSEAMPRSDRLPCGIALETAGVWGQFYELEPRSRTLFPKDCEFFEKRS